MWKVFSVCFNNSRKQDMAPANGCRREINCGCGGMCTAPCERWLNQMGNLISPWTGLLHAKSKKSIEFYVRKLRVIMVRGRVTLRDLVRLTCGMTSSLECRQLGALSLTGLLKLKYWKLSKEDAGRVEILKLGQQIDSIIASYLGQFQADLGAAGLPNDEMVAATVAVDLNWFYCSGEELGMKTVPCTDCGRPVVPTVTVSEHKTSVGDLCPDQRYQAERALEQYEEQQQQRRSPGRGRGRGRAARPRTPSPQPGGANYSVVDVATDMVTCRVRGGVATYYQ